jgi:hypothetical protein
MALHESFSLTVQDTMGLTVKDWLPFSRRKKFVGMLIFVLFIIILFVCRRVTA